MPNLRLRRAGLAAACLTVPFVAGSTAGAASPRQVIGTGPDYVYGTNSLSGATATVSAADLGSDGMQFALQVADIDAPAGTELGAHLHMAPCGSAPGSSGGHYAHPGTDGPLQQREVWLDFVVDANGRGRAVATRDWTPTNRADRSVVIHVLGTDHETGAAGTRLACIDLDA